MITPPPDERITIGKILKPCGVRGEVKVLPLTHVPERFEPMTTVAVHCAQGNDIPLVIEHVREYKGCVYLRFREKQTIEAVQPLIGGLLQVDRGTAPELPEGVYYHFEILDMVVYTEAGQRLGTVVDILETGSNDVYVIQEQEREYLIPAIAEVIQQIDREKGVIIIHPLEGLLEL